MNWETLQEKIQPWLDRMLGVVHKKGQERLTIMVIPHNHEKIFSIHINWFMILFLSGILGFVVFLASYSYYQKQRDRAEVDHLRDLYGLNYTQAYKIHQNAKEIQEANEELRSRMESISRIIGLEEELDSLPSLRSARSKADSQLFKEIMNRNDMAPGSSYLPPVYSLKAAEIQFEDELPLLSFLDTTIGDGIYVYVGIPTGRPFHSMAGLRDSSPFGIRVDPVSGNQLEFHTGMDMSGSRGTPIYATAAGEVIRIRYNDPGYGNYVIIRHRYGFATLYGHMDRHALKQGQWVKRGQLVGTMGRTGRVTGDHLHYEVFRGESDRIDPLPFVCSIEFASARCQRFYADEGD